MRWSWVRGGRNSGCGLNCCQESSIKCQGLPGYTGYLSPPLRNGVTLRNAYRNNLCIVIDFRTDSLAMQVWCRLGGSQLEWSHVISYCSRVSERPKWTQWSLCEGEYRDGMTRHTFQSFISSDKLRCRESIAVNGVFVVSEGKIGVHSPCLVTKTPM